MCALITWHHCCELDYQLNFGKSPGSIVQAPMCHVCKLQIRFLPSREIWTQLFSFYQGVRILLPNFTWAKLCHLLVSQSLKARVPDNTPKYRQVRLVEGDSIYHTNPARVSNYARLCASRYDGFWATPSTKTHTVCSSTSALQLCHASVFNFKCK